MSQNLVMTTFFYDKTFEGLLSALFDAYVNKEFPDALVARGAPEPMFTERRWSVVTDPAKSTRVWRALEKKLPKYALNMLMYAWFSEEQDSDLLILRYMKVVFDSPHAVITDFGNPAILSLKQLADKVSRDKHRVIEFVRFRKAADGTYFAPINPLYNSLPLTLSYFTDRFADQRWLLYDVRRKYGYFYDTKTVVEITLPDDSDIVGGKLPDELMDQDEQLFQKMWKTYFDAMAIKERINPKLQRQHMPRHYWKYMTEKM